MILLFLAKQSAAKSQPNQANPLRAQASAISSSTFPNHDPKLITYPGDLHFALLINSQSGLKQASSDQEPLECDFDKNVNAVAIYHGMAAIWAAHQINLKKGNPNQLKIGVYLYDGCSNSGTVQRQTVRLLAQLNEVNVKNCREPRAAPLFGKMQNFITSDFNPLL